MIRETGMQQQYCLRWNNHKTNLLMVFSELFRNEDFTDVTLACEGGSVIKCHKMVLAACSSYFQNLFSDLSCSHPVVVLKDIRYSEIQAILEYMYKGEVSITQEEVEPLLRVAEALKVKGLVGENEHRNKSEYNNSSISTSSSPYDASSRDREPSGGAHSSITRTTSMPNDLSNRDRDRDNANDNESNHNSPINENQLNASDDKNDRNDSSPPHSTSLHQSFHKNAHFYGKSPSNSDRLGNRIPPLPIWPMTGLPMTTFPTPHTTATAAAMLNSCHDAVIAASNSSMPPLRRKKLSSLLMNRDRDTPILRTVLGQSQADSSQPMSLVCHDGQEQEPQSNGPTMPQDLSYMNKSMKMETMSEDAHSPYMETSSFMDEDFSQDRGNKAMHSSSSSPQSFYLDSKVSVSSAIANYVPTQKPEWKRYKQYTRHDIMSAIEAVRNGMSALQAARKFGVPSRTLYDKVKKLGVTRITNRPFRRSNGSTGAAFPFGISGAGGSMLIGMPSEEENSPQSGMLEHGFLQHALEGGKLKMESSDHEAMSSTPISLQHGFMQRNLEIEERMKTLNVEERMKAEMNEREALSMVQGNASGGSSSPTPNDRSPSPSPNLIKYAQHSNSLTPSPPLPPPIPPPDDDYEDQVEDLSMSRKPEQQSRVIMPPMNQATATTVLATCSGDGGRD